MAGLLNELARFISAPGAATVNSLLSEKSYVSVALGSITREDGTILTAQATSVAGYSQLSNLETVINIPVNCSAGEELGFNVPIPIDLDVNYPLEVHVLVGKAANNDTLTLDCEVYMVGPGDVGNADCQGTAATTITQAASELVFTCTTSAMRAAPGAISVVLLLGGTNDQDAVYIYGVWLEYTKQLLNA
jgi:hypothetical protein